ncbi:G patch domain-containing protein 4 [Ictalurus furcatus]|uniref:G patch domain-containing protein 4 n=1 Tax=Ictalurus furcatus TaxID=66913 RepID=UPI00235040A4|nr:G patch domain-containing protein 4 [Ictalurus furcatus]
MSQTAEEKSRGLKFAEQQLLRHGWEQGKGLGRAENGISEAIRVKVKCDRGGVGHKEGEQFTFHWWDHVFNKASASLAVESDQNEVVVKKMEEEEDGMISNKKPRKAMMNKSMLYGCFVKSATLLSGQEQPEQTSSDSEDSSSEDEEKLDLSSTKNLSDAELMKACGGRTAHKGARHGLTMSAKLARLEQQEQEFMAEYGKNKQMDQTISLSEAAPTELSSALDQGRAEKTEQKKAKKKKQRSDEPKENGVQDNTAASWVHNEEISKKRKKRSKDKADLESEDITDIFVDTDTKKKKKKSKLFLEEESTEIVQEGEVAETAEHQQTDESISKKKRRKKKKHSEKSSALEEGQSKNIVLANEESEETTESHEHEQQEEGTAALHPTPDVYKKKKKKSSKANKVK